MPDPSPSPLPGHSPCFGRARLIARLEERFGTRGVTFLMTPPRQGKTWLILNTASRRIEAGDLVGYAHASGGNNDLLHVALRDLYSRWLSEASLADQAKSLYDAHKERLVGKIGTRVGRVLAAGLKPIGLDGAMKEIFEGLAAADDALATGGLQLRPIAFEDAMALINTLAMLHPERRVLLAMDAWEQRSEVASDDAAVRALVGRLHEWPERVHVAIVIRDLPEHLPEVKFAQDCARDTPMAKCWDGQETGLAELELSDEQERERLLLHLHETVPATRQREASWLLAQCAQPAVIEWWTRERPTDPDLLGPLADEARNSSYRGLITLLGAARADSQALFDAAVAVALLPEMRSREDWAPFEGVAEELGVTTDALDDLRSRRVLDPNALDHPSFGHTTAYQAVLAFFRGDDRRDDLPDPTVRTRRMMQRLVARLAGRVTGIDTATFPYALAMARIGARFAMWDDETVTVASMAGLFFNIPLTPRQSVWMTGNARSWTSQDPTTALFVAMSLNNGHVDAMKADESGVAASILDELRGLRSSHTENGAVRKELAMTLFNSHRIAGDAGETGVASALLDELRGLRSLHVEDSALREHLVKALYNAHYDAGDAGETDIALCLLDELRGLRSSHIEDGVVREQLAKVLYNAHHDARRAGESSVASSVLEELRGLCMSHIEDGTVREQLAEALYNEHHDASRAGESGVASSLLNELRGLYSSHPEDWAVREQLAMALFNMHHVAEDAGEPGVASCLLDELRGLRSSHVEDGVVRERLATAICNSHIEARKAGDNSVASSLLDELRVLRSSHAEDGAVREQLAKALGRTALDAAQGGDWGACIVCFNELEDVAYAEGRGAVMIFLLAALLRMPGFDPPESARSELESKTSRALATAPDDVLRQLGIDPPGDADG